MQIGELAELTGMSVPTLRHYDEVDLVSPSRRSRGGFRLYSEDDVRRLMVVRRMKPLGYGVDEMRALLVLLDRLPEAEGDERLELVHELERMTVAARDRRAALATKLGMADEFLDILRSHLPVDPPPA